MCRGAGGAVGAARAEKRSGCQRRLALRARRQWRGGCAPGCPRQPGRCLALRARRRRSGRCEPWRLHLLPPLTYACCLLVVGMSKTSCALRCSRRSAQRVLRAPAEGEGGVAHREELAAATSATLERSAGMVADRDGTRGRLASGVAPVGKGSRRRRAGCARPAGRGRLERASEDLWWWVVRTPTSNYLRLASPNRGKYWCPEP